MPSYIYKCVNDKCSLNEQENTIVKKMSEPTPNCSECSQELTQVFRSAIKFSLKGKGWTGSSVAQARDNGAELVQTKNTK